MKPLISCKKLFTLLCLCPADELSSKFDNRALFVFAIVNFSVLVCTSASCAMYIKEIGSTNLSGSLQALVTSSIDLCTAYTLMFTFRQRNEINEIFDKLSVIYNASEDTSEDSIQFLTRANNNSEWWWRGYCKYVIATSVGVTMTFLSSIPLCWLLRGGFDVDYVYHPIHDILPWNQTTFIGYSMEASFSIISVIFYVISNAAFLLLFIYICIHHAAFYEIFKRTIDKLNNGDGIRCDHRFLCDLIRFHMSVKEWFLETAEVCSPFLMVQLIDSVVNLSVSLVFLNMEIQNFNFNMPTVTTCLLVFMAMLFLYCYFGQLATDSFEKMPNLLNNTNWYDLPLGLQKYFVLMFQNMQQPLEYHGFGLAILNLNTYINLIKNVISYYMIFRTLTSE